MTTLKKGDKAPNFSGIDQDGILHKLADYKGKKLVVFFYPKANTPGCTAEACDLRDNFERFQANNYALLGVSADAAKAQAFIAAYQAVRPFTPAERQLLNPMLRAGALRFWTSRLWDFHLPRAASMLQAHDPGHFERVLRERISHADALSPSAIPA